MTVKELIERLLKVENQDAVVVVSGGSLAGEEVVFVEEDENKLTLW